MASETGGRLFLFFAVLLTVLLFFAQPPLEAQVSGKITRAPQSPKELHCSQDNEQLFVPPGAFTMGSTTREREFAYGLDNEITRRYGWYEKEIRRRPTTNGFCIDRNLVTNGQYKRFVDETGYRVPTISAEAYQLQGFLVHPYEKVKEFLWTANSYPPGRKDHPVVLVSNGDAVTYCKWRGEKAGGKYRLPKEEEWEKAARGTDGRMYPWGNMWVADILNSGDRYGTTTPVGQFPLGKSPYGLYDMAGNTFEWTSTPWDTPPMMGQARKMVLKGCSWDDLPGTCRAAMRHGRLPTSKHILIGFRCVSELGG